MGNNSTKSYLKIPKVQQPRELERPPTSKLNPRAEKIQGEGGSHGTEKLRQYKKEVKIPRIMTGTVSSSLRLMPGEGNLRAFLGFRKIIH